jgi:uncharacterized protein (DUF1330 family)
MPAYVVVQVQVDEPVGYERYKSMVQVSIAHYGGRFLVRGGHVDTLEGTWHPARLVILEFADAQQAHAWWASPEYAPAKALRHATSRAELIVVEGV